MPIKTAVIGFGYWGPNLARNVFANKNLKLEVICDINQIRIEKAHKLYPLVKLTTNVEEVFKDKKIESVIICTPVSTHYELAKRAIESNKHVLLEKPMTSSIAEAEDLLYLSQKHDKVILVDHIFMYNGAVRKIKDLIDKGTLGEIKYIDSTRINLGIFQNDVNVLWDLASHDISIINYLIKERPTHIQAIGKNHYHEDIENIAFLIMHYDSGLIAHFNCSWSSPVKIRQMLIGGLKKKIVYDDIEPSDKIKVYDSGMTFKKAKDKQKILVDYRIGDISIPKFSITEPLALVVEDFVKAIRLKKPPVSDGYLGMEVVKTLDIAQKSLKQNGKLLSYS